MHIMVSWEIRLEGAEYVARDDALRASLEGKSWARALSTTYVIRLDSTSMSEAITERETLLKAIVAAMGDEDQDCSVIASPPINKGMYQGWLDDSVWAEINQRSV